MIIELLLWPLLSGLGVALVSGPLGAFVVWRRMAYFGDTLAHGALLGVALGVGLQLHPLAAVLLSSIALALLLLLLQRQPQLTNDTLLGILSHSALAAGLVGVSLLADTRIDVYGLLFGDLLTAGPADAGMIALMALIIGVVLARLWQPLLLATLDENLARVEGVPTEKLRAILLVQIAVLIAFAMKVVGVLLITALLIIPAATARRLSRSPEAMAVQAAMFGALAIIAGLAASYRLDIPAGPGIALSAAIVFFAVTLFLSAKRG